MRWLCNVLLFLAFADQKLVSGQLNIGDPCLYGTGYCKLLPLCNPVYAELVLARKRPDFICGNYRYIPIVCCPDTTTVGDNVTEQSINQSLASVRTIRRAEQKCHEYATTHAVLPHKHLLKVSGGTMAKVHEFPHMTAIGFVKDNKISWNCGGSLISELWVLSASHCTFNHYWGPAEYVRVGAVNLNKNDNNGLHQNRKVIQRVRHPKYKPPAQYHDIALLKMDRPVELNFYVRPACLSLEPNVEPNEQVIVSGWGAVDQYDNTVSPNLLKVTLPIVTHEVCREYYKNEGNNLPYGISSKTQFCAGETGKDACRGDSGGPVMVYSRTYLFTYDIIGITSYGKSCGLGTPGIYTKVSYYLDWIERMVWP